ncbi:DUF317 domain-containing protein [Streptomyces spororaveus]|uniref:DUF317 domain-containing protein n=1 Tax=Streptomyces spororaveus TaxID=284039 RepID=A0ABQ3T7C6_9ACTN|nr:DUF317 domain-containing protein [Streptomyces spororaveus]GHI76274.1 hypothetical protein Sspor_18350 [Streptomyces spororaveus]
MPQPGLGEAHIRLARHPDHSSAVTATLAGPESSRNLARTALSNRGFRWIDLKTLVLARIDHEEPYYADQAARALRDVGATVEIAPSLQEEIDTEWTYGNYPMPYLDRDEIREVSAEAQRIHDDIASGRLTIHLHAHDGWTTVAVGTYRNGKSVHFHGEDYLRQETADYETEAEAVADFHSQYAVAVRPGPAPLTDIERTTAQLLTTPPSEAPKPSPAQRAEPTKPKPETVPVYAADPGDHEDLLDTFLESQDEWEKVRTWSDGTTIANHESLTMRVQFFHEAYPGAPDTWTVASYESPVGERLWHATATRTTPVEIVSTLLDSLAAGKGWGPGPATAVTDKTLAEATRYLAETGETGWPLTVNARVVEWTAPTEEPAGVRFDTFAASRPNSPLEAWTVWGGNTPDQPTWSIRFSTHTPPALLQDITFELAHGTGHRQPHTDTAGPAAHLPGPPAVARPHSPAARPAAPR